MPFSIQSELAAMEEEEKFMVKGALDTIDHYIKANGYRCVLRDDSRLAFLWASGGGGGQVSDCPMSEIAEEMAVMQFVCDTTLYNSVIEDALRNMANAIKSKHKKLTWTTVWEIVKKYGPDIIRYQCLYDLFLSSNMKGLPNMCSYPGA